MNASFRLTMTLAILTMATAASAQYGDDDFPALPSRLGDLTGPRYSDAPVDSFRRAGDGLSSRSRGEQTRYRIPLDRGLSDFRNNSDFSDRLNLRDRERFDPGSRLDRYQPRLDSMDVPDRYQRELDDEFDAPRFNNRYDDRFEDLRRPGSGRDPFVPAPLPENRIDSEGATIDQLITARYQNPVTVRALRSMSTNAAVQLFAEVNQKIDERSLAPTSYDVRVRRALRNLTIALDNPAFVKGLGISADSFRTDSFRNTLSRLADNGQVRNYQDARSVLNTVMQSAQSVSGLTPAIVAFEFANASIDTLDKFSGLEISDVASRNGASLDTTKSAALEEEIVGVGIEVKEHAEGLVVVKPLRGSPAEEAGIQSGDIIVSINNREIAGMSMASSVDLMKGTSGSQMKVRIYRDGKGERDFVLTRRKVRVWTVNDTKLLNGTDVGYFSLSRFSQSSTAELDQALNTLHSKGMKSLILDLRGNPGGLLTTCVEVSDRFLACGTIVSTKGRLSSDSMVEQATFNRTWNVPLVVLIDGDSASASEIFAAAIQENRRGVVVGTKSYGKGSVQTHFPLGAIGGDLRLTTAMFYSPNGRKMAGEGVTPDVEIDDRDGVVNGDEVLIEAVRIARSRTLSDMAKSAGSCRPRSSASPRSSSLDGIADPTIHATTVR